MADTSPNTEAPADSGMVEHAIREMAGTALDLDQSKGLLAEIKIRDATRLQLDWIVANIENVGCFPPRMQNWRIVPVDDSAPVYSPVTDSTQGRRIIEREQIACARWVPWPTERWWASIYDGQMRVLSRKWGPTQLIAAMRCFAAYRLGEVALVPKALAQMGRHAEIAASDSHPVEVDESPARERSRG